MKRFLLLGFFILLCSSVKAQSTYLRSQEIGSPVYRKLTDLYLKHDGKIDMATVEFKNKLGLVTKEKWIFRIQGNETPELKLMTLPLSLEKISCSVQITFSLAGADSGIDNREWGQCINPAPRPDDKYLPDLLVSDENTSPLNFAIINEGKSIIEKNVSFFSWIEDESGKLIWFKEVSQLLTMSPEDSRTINLNDELSPWQKKLGCSASIVIDSKHDLYEKKKKNNVTTFKFGACEHLPVQGVDLYDFSPEVNIEDGKIYFGARNLGRLPMLNDYEAVEGELQFLNGDGNSIQVVSSTIRAPFYGFEQYKEFISTTVPVGTVLIKVLVNKNNVLKESNYSNNIQQFSYSL